MKYAVIIPSGGGPHLDNCLDSMSKEVRSNTLIYKNAPGIVERDDVLGYGGVGVNDGVSAGWNFGVRYVIRNELDYLVIVSQHVLFTEGMNDLITELETNKPEWGTLTQEGWHCVALSRKCLEEVGEFDTNFYPIYYEDTDYELRWFKHGIINEVYETKIGALKTPGGFSTTLGMRPEVEGCKRYFIEKWGEIFDYMNYEKQNFYPTPFNDPDNDLSYFPRYTTQELFFKQGYDKRPLDLYITSVRGK